MVWDYKLLHQGPLEWRHLRAKFYEILPSGSEVLVRDTQTGDLISLYSFLESRLRMYKYFLCILAELL
jgi:hypothetical protein